jgi:hypothetical protein
VCKVVTKPLRYFLRGIIANVIILAVISLYLLVSIALNYKGRCGVFWFFGGEGHPCPRSEYVMEVASFIFFGILDDTETWLLILLALGILPSLGYLIGRRRGSKKYGMM